VQPIDDPDDPRLDRFRGLIDRGDRHGPDCFFVESETAVARLLSSPHFTTLAVLGTRAHLERLAPTCPTYAVSRELLRAVLGFDLHRGVIACAARPPQLSPHLSLQTCPIGPVIGAPPVPEASLSPPVPTDSLADPPVPTDSLAEPAPTDSFAAPVPAASLATTAPPVLTDSLAAPPVPEASLATTAAHVPTDSLAAPPVPEASLATTAAPVLTDSLAAALAAPRWTVLLVQGLADPANLGSILRSARAFAIDLVLLDRRGADPLSRRAVRSAMGHVFTQPLALVDDLPAALALLKNSDELRATIWAATVSPRARPLGSLARPDRLVLLVGNEGVGLPATLCAQADAEVTIPLAPEVDSLGVAAATAILLHALTSGI
jgi:tRNA G18 (ribose-2'-O)-methylase SpoU